ncbi:4-diphosphocytidyl-2-C-methyl-D-erythritol kinase [Candidatus Burkholderia humilis]|nr:4-diphosphocytidyl-2-C-methyl-D-erythritol kinase [Candidatus Burkholderia humilis]
MTSSTDSLRNCLAPAKLNLFLHITGRRPDGYHSLQTVFQLLDWGDRLHFTRRDDGVITRKTDVPGVPEADDLVVRAARLLQQHTSTKYGVEIEIDKVLPMGAGLGGGSSDAATTFFALNRLWGVDLSRETMQNLGLQLGADVPFFVFGQNAFAEGVGEALQAVNLPQRFFLIVIPSVHVPTAAIFSEKSLTRDSKVAIMIEFLAEQRPDSFGRNDMQAVVARKYAEVAQVLEWFANLAPARMTGSGACVFAAFQSKAEAEMAQAKLPASWKSVVTASLDSHPLFAFAS